MIEINTVNAISKIILNIFAILIFNSSAYNNCNRLVKKVFQNQVLKIPGFGIFRQQHQSCKLCHDTVFFNQYTLYMTLINIYCWLRC